MAANVMRAAVFGASGFVGRHLVMRLGTKGYSVRAIGRGDGTWRGMDLGHVFYTIGLTADFRSRPFDTIDAHVAVLTDVLRNARFESLVYCSSTRVYAGGSSTDEADPLAVRPADPDHLYNISKLMGEAACLGSGSNGARVARLANVFGADDVSQNFLTSVITDAVGTGRVKLRTSLSSSKDYVAVDDVAEALIAIAERGAEPITNVASGRNTTHAEIAEALSAATGAEVEVEPGSPTITFPRIETGRLDRLVPGERMRVTDAISRLVAAFRLRGDKSPRG